MRWVSLRSLLGWVRFGDIAAVDVRIRGVMSRKIETGYEGVVYVLQC